ncbi:MAG TPA: divalent metal cation transporter [Anaerolineaceae bacterium]|nr:divalent metal cation transporter [Anaerolineaceae bacterium]
MPNKSKSPIKTTQDNRTLTEARAVLRGRSKKGRFGSLLPFLGPAFIASVAYVDPGNFATNIAGGAQYGYTLLWVIIASNLMAILIQSLSAKLGIASGMNLAEQCRAHFKPWFVKFLWVLMELVAMATDLAEFLGAAIGFNLLLGIPLWVAGILTGITTFLILGLERKGFRPLEAVISAMVGVVAISYVVETIIVKPVWKDVFYHAVVPSFDGSGSVLLAAGILGATVMPHAIYLHSALMQGRVVVKKPKEMKRLFHFEQIDILIAMGMASLINGAMLIMAASSFHLEGMTHIGTLEQAYITLQPLMGKASQFVFGLSLLASGLSSASVGTMAGQVIMAGFLHWEIPVWIRRLVTMVPSMIVIAIGLDPSQTLVISQVLLSFGLPFAVIPLVIFTSKKEIMGVLVNRKVTTFLASGVAAIILALNVYLLYSTFFGG